MSEKMNDEKQIYNPDGTLSTMKTAWITCPDCYGSGECPKWSDGETQEDGSVKFLFFKCCGLCCGKGRIEVVMSITEGVIGFSEVKIIP